MGFQILVVVFICFQLFHANADPVRGDNVTSSCATTKSGGCPPTAINPSIFTCSDHPQCRGNRICCLSAGNYFCSDPAGSKSSAKCPTTIANRDNPCYSDFNCDAGPDQPPKTCCFDESTCASYCADDVTPNPANDPAAQLNLMKKDDNCPTTLKNSLQDCTAHIDCPRNQICCLNGRLGKRCSDPLVLVPGQCPDPPRLPFGPRFPPCAADGDCATEKYTGQKCCRLDDAHYRCAYPDDGAVTPVTPPASPTQPPTGPPTRPPTVPPTQPSVIPPTLQPTPPPITVSTSPSTNSSITTTYPPIYPTVAPVCPLRIKMCPSSLLPCQDIQCAYDRICCEDSLGRKGCTVPRATKPGKCPPSNQVLKIGNECFFDSNCRGNSKCCGGRGCSYYSCASPDNSL